MTDKDLVGKVALVTGANSGIGRVTAEALAARGARVLLACRSEEKTRPVLGAIRAAGGDAVFLPLDLGDLESVRACAAAVLARDEPLHLLINNAGLAAARGVTKQGFEIAFGTNHLGHFLLTTLLLPRLRASRPARIVNVSSLAHRRAKRLDFEALRRPTASRTGLEEYGVSKLCNILFTSELARGRAGEGVQSFSLHPGVVGTDAWRRLPRLLQPVVKLFMLTPEDGARTTLHCATSPEVGGARRRVLLRVQAGGDVSSRARRGAGEGALGEERGVGAEGGRVRLPPAPQEPQRGGRGERGGARRGETTLESALRLVITAEAAPRDGISNSLELLRVPPRSPRPPR
jgi:NAD(P)-dependent dehydrogenase (short-subunit alcohol dehydrogenase family)